jgi:two-component system, NarL family, sensor kinase
VSFPLLHEGRSVGRLVASPRTADDELSTTDRRLLADVAGHAAVAAHAVLLARDIRRSRTRVLAAREEERRRIRRDLHDGLGPTLAAVVLGLETARRRCDVSPQQAGALIERLASDVQDTIGDIRRLVHDLRPPILDQLGLADAIRADARRFETDCAATREPLSISVDAPSASPPLPAAVEVATYRIAGEAMTNVVRHAAAHHCVVRLIFDDGVELEIRDDGRGLPVDAAAGVGMLSMSERAADVGGRCQVDSPAGGGTRVLARLPREPMP